MNDAEQRTAWSSLAKDEQTALLIAFGHHLDGLPPTCSIDVKEQRLRDWLGQRGIDYPGAG